jgi:hypothetical protein
MLQKKFSSSMLQFLQKYFTSVSLILVKNKKKKTQIYLKHLNIIIILTKNIKKKKNESRKI